MGGEDFITFSETDINEMTYDEPISDNGIINYASDPTDDQQEPNSITKNDIYVEFQFL